MRRWLARNVFYPSQDALCGRDSVRYAMELESRQWMNPEAIAEMQVTKLRRLLAEAIEQTPFYSARSRRVGLCPDDIRRLSDLRHLDVLSREHVRQHHPALVARNPGPRATWASTSGSSGQPLEFLLDTRRRRADIAARLRAHRWFGIEPGDPAVYLWGPCSETAVVSRLKGLRDWLINETLLNAFELSPEHLQRYADRMMAARPTYVYAYASALWRMARFIGDFRPELKGVVRRVAFATGEEMIPSWRREIIAALECSVAEEYGTREAGLIAHECPAEAYHVMAENVIVEILDEQDQPVTDGVEGRIVVTNLEARAMPFIRYDTGDHGALRPGRCACGLGLPMMERPSGRAHEFLETSDGVPITARSISREFAEIRGIEQYRVIQEARDRVRVLAVSSTRDTATLARIERQVVTRIQRHLGPAAVITEFVEALKSEPSGKFPYIINAMRRASSGQGA